MNGRVKPIRVDDAYADLLERSLSTISCDLGRLIYLASTRDYNTGSYHHEGLAVRFQPDAAREALKTAHEQIFLRIAGQSLEELVAQLEKYLDASRQDVSEVLRAWQRLEPYRIAIPMAANATVARFFLSNIRLAVAIVRHRQEQASPSYPQGASQPQLPAR